MKQLTKQWKQVLKFVVSISLLIFLFSRIDLDALLRGALSADVVLYTAGFLLSLIKIVIGAWRWQLLLASKKRCVHLLKLTQIYLISSFYNLLLPTALGGDVVRIIMASKEIDSKSEAVSSVFIERFLGFFSLSTIALLSLVIGQNIINNNAVTLFVVVAFIAFIIGFLSLFSQPLARIFLNIFKMLNMNKLHKTLTSFYTTFHNYSKNKKALLTCFAVSFLYQIVGILTIYLIGLAINIEIAFVYYLIFIPLIWIIMMAPISISGIGVREGAFAYFFSMVGVDTEKALLLSLLFFSHSILAGVLGGLLNIKNSFTISDGVKKS